MSGAVAPRYAAALADVGASAEEHRSSEERPRGVREAFFSSTDLRTVLESPAVGQEAKQKVVEQIAAHMEYGAGGTEFRARAGGPPPHGNAA